MGPSGDALRARDPCCADWGRKDWMPTDVGLVEIVVSPDSMRAMARVNPDGDESDRAEAKLLSILAAQSIDITEDVRDRVRLLSERLGAKDYPLEDVLLAQGAPPEPGTDGRVEWNPDCDPTQRHFEPPEETLSGVVDHYARSTIVSISEGDLVCTLVPPVPGTPGRDVFGREVPAKKVHRCPLHFGEGLAEKDGEPGRIVATISGRVNYVGNQVWISPLLTIYRHVDFQVGNIDFDGDVLIRGNVLDLFTVKCTKSLVIRGLVEGARIECGGDLAISGGVAGKEKAVIVSGGKVAARFIDNATVVAAGDVVVEKEMVNSTIATESCLITRGAITACKIEAAGGIEAGIVGSKSGIRTELSVGSSRETFRRLGRADRDIVALEEKIERHRGQLTPLLQRQASLPLIQKNTLTRLLKEVKAEMEELDRLKLEREQLQNSIRSHRAACIDVRRMIHDGTTVNIGEATATLRDALRGPLKLVSHPVDGAARVAASSKDGGLVLLESLK